MHAVAGPRPTSYHSSIFAVGTKQRFSARDAVFWGICTNAIYHMDGISRARGGCIVVSNLRLLKDSGKFIFA